MLRCCSERFSFTPTRLSPKSAPVPPYNDIYMYLHKIINVLSAYYSYVYLIHYIHFYLYILIDLFGKI